MRRRSCWWWLLSLHGGPMPPGRWPWSPGWASAAAPWPSARFTSPSARASSACSERHPLYLVIVFGVVGLVAYSRALERASLARVTAILLVTEVTVPGLAGIVLLGDSVRPGWWAAMSAGLVLAVAGVVVLAGSPAQQPPPLRGDDVSLRGRGRGRGRGSPRRASAGTSPERDRWSGAAHAREGKVNTSQDVVRYSPGIERAGAEGAEQPLRSPVLQRLRDPYLGSRQCSSLTY